MNNTYILKIMLDKANKVITVEVLMNKKAYNIVEEEKNIHNYTEQLDDMLDSILDLEAIMIKQYSKPIKKNIS